MGVANRLARETQAFKSAGRLGDYKLAFFAHRVILFSPTMLSTGTVLIIIGDSGQFLPPQPLTVCHEELTVNHVNSFPFP